MLRNFFLELIKIQFLTNVKWSVFGYSFFFELLIPTKLYMKHPKKCRFMTDITPIG